MLKIYKKEEGKLHYWETWEADDKTSVIHWGVVGDRGNSKKIEAEILKNRKKQLKIEIADKANEGYRVIEDENHYTLLIEFEIEGMGSASDLQKRTRLQDRMNETLGWTGLGHCDGGSIGSGTMEVCCFVVDFDIAKNVIVENLKNTEFSDYTRIFDENL